MAARLLSLTFALLVLTPAYAVSQPSKLPPLLESREPYYPARALALRIEGQVTATFDITADGLVDNINLIGCESFFRETKAALKHWRFAPGHPLNGQNTVLTFRIRAANGKQNPPFDADGCYVAEKE